MVGTRTSMPYTRSSPRTRRSTRISQGASAASPSMALRHKMKEKIQQSVGKERLSEPRRQSISDTTSLPKKRAAVLPDLDNDTPRVVLRKIIRTQPQVSPLVPPVHETKQPEESGSQPPSERISSGLEMHLPDSVPDGTALRNVARSRKKKKFSISEFERGADERLPRALDQPTLDNTALTRSLQISLATPVPPESVEKRGLIRRPKNRRAVNVEAFEGGVEQHLLQMKGTQNYLVESQATSLIGVTMGASDTEIILSNTELFAQPQRGEQSYAGVSALDPTLSRGKTAAPGSRVSSAAAGEGPVLDVGAEERTPQSRQGKDLAQDPEHADQLAAGSRGLLGAEQRERTRGSSYSEPLPGADELAAGSVQSPSRARTPSSSRRSGASSAPSPERSGRKSLKEAVEREVVPDAGAVPGEEGDSEEEEMTEEEAETEEPVSDELSTKTPAFVRARAFRPFPLPATPRSLSTAAAASALLPPKPSLAPRAARGAARAPRRKREPALPSSLIKKIFSHFVKVPVAREAVTVVEKCVEVYFGQLCKDLEAYTSHAGRKTVEEADLELLMRRQGLVTDKMPLRVLIERHLPLEYRKLLIPVAMSGNKVIPRK
ncbi:centromere protein T isoform X3 [Pelodiscus sinensis]|uniref:centromere protein T isoform X3 n=1 Tax=Pelodiscus sinensis TaxID=13735 RepID=UPI003F6C9284